MKTDLRWVQSAVRRPHRCALIPFIGQNHAKGFIDTGTTFWGERVYLSVEGLELAARFIGWVPGSDVRRVESVLAFERRRLEAVEAERDQLREQLAAIGTLKAAGFTQTRKSARQQTAKAA